MSVEESYWSRPSQSRRVRFLLYLAESTIIGSAVVMLSVWLGGFLLLMFPEFESGTVSAATLFLLFLLAFFVIRSAGIIRIANRYARENPPAVHDWQETRQWIWVGVGAVVIGGLLLGISVYLSDWSSVLIANEGALLRSVAILSGFALYLYTYSRLGVKVV